MNEKRLKITDLCPCGSKIKATDCCLVFINEEQKASTAELLMRSRYTAYALGYEEYILKTWHSSQRPASPGLGESVEWLGLKVLQASKDKDNEAFVEFIALFSDAGKTAKMHERSRFVREQGVWFYVDGVQVESNTLHNLKSPGRNDPCYCGSGKKFKKCCGKAN